MSKNNISEHLSIFALGGLGEIGKNMYIVQYKNDIVVIDAGLMFPEEEMLGIDVVIPDITYLLNHQEKVRGILVTHGHEDHIGGLPYVLKSLQVPVYATRLTMGLIEGKLKENGILGQTRRHVIHENSMIQLGAIKASFFRTNHSIPDSVGICLDTPEGVVVHTGDFKFDLTPVNGFPADLHKMAEIGKSGVLCLLSDSTNAERPGGTPSERSVSIAIQEEFARSTQRIVVTTFASNVYRIQQVFDAAKMFNRKVTIVGRSMQNVINISKELGYLHVSEEMIIEPEEVNRLPANEIVILSTGSQGEPLSALTTMARGTNRKVEILPGDKVIIAATPIPGNERFVGRVVDELFRLGAEVVYGTTHKNIHVSGHGSQSDLLLMLQLMKPEFFIPIHGEFRMLRQHAQLAIDTGIDPDNIFIVNNGEAVEFSHGRAHLGAKIPIGNTLVDGLGVGDVGNIVLRDRKLLSQDGILVVVVTISKQNRTVLSGPDIISRGFVYVRESEALLEEANKIVSNTLNKIMVEEKTHEWSTLKTAVRESLGHFLYEQTKRRPMILPIIMEV